MQPASFSASVLTSRPKEVAEFYRTYFDLEPTADIGWFISLRRPGADWEVCVWDETHESVPPIRTGHPTGAVLAFIVPDAASVATRLESDGVPLIEGLRDEVWGQRHFFVADPAGTPIDVVQFTTPDPEWLKANGITLPA